MKRTALILTFLLTFSILFVASESFTVRAETVNSSVLMRHFEVNLVYAYVPSGAYATAIFNFTLSSNETLPIDGITDVYSVEILSNGDVIGNSQIGCTIGASPAKEYIMDLTMSLGHLSVSTGYGLKEWSIFYKPQNPSLAEPVSINISLMGWIVVDGNSTRFNLNSDEAIQQVNLEKFQNGYLYNIVVPEEQLSQIDLLTPPRISDQNSTSATPSSSPVQEPGSLFEITTVLSTELVLVSVILVAAAFVVILVYFTKRKQNNVLNLAPAKPIQKLSSSLKT